jgi:YesN/AraC family two-component response regulator
MMNEILVMDHEARETFWITLKSDYKILFATTAKKGLNMLSENVDLVFLSIELQDMNSMEVFRLIKQEYPSTAVIIIASCGTEEMYMEAFGKAGGPTHIVDGVLKVRDFVTQNYSESLTLTAACKMASISKTYFCRFFKNITGHSLRSYHHAVKIRMAEELLRDKRLSIKDIARRLGYHDSNYFSTIYKKFTGVSPKQRQTYDQSPDKKKEELEKIQGQLQETPANLPKL